MGDEMPGGGSLPLGLLTRGALAGQRSREVDVCPGRLREAEYHERGMGHQRTSSRRAVPLSRKGILMTLRVRLLSLAVSAASSTLGLDVEQ
jgi:hypothetical protein